MTIKNQALYNALQDVSSKAAVLQSYRELVVEQEQRIAEAKEAALTILNELDLGGEQLGALLGKPIQAGDTIITITGQPGALAIELSTVPETLNIYELMGDEERAAVRQRVAARRAAGEEG
jgi:hypothetical protein